MADRSVKVIVSAKVQGFVAGMRTAQGSVTDFTRRASDGFERNQQHIDQLSGSAARLGVGLTALAGFAIKSAMDWESAWAGVTKTIDGTPAQLAAIEQGLQDMSAVKPTTAIELAEIAESAGALGVRTEDILSFTSVMADLGQTTNLTSDEAATSIAQLMNVMQTAPEDVDNLGATLVDLGNKGASTERQIVEMAQNIAGAGAIVGLTEANVLSLGNALASSGIDAEAGGSAISNVLIDIDKAVSTGSDKLDQFAQVAGTTADDFAAKWAADPADALASFVEGLGRMNASGGDVFTTLSQLGQSDIRVTRALLNMAASGDMLRVSLANGDAAWEKNTALTIEAAKRYDTTAAQAKMAWNEVKTSAVDAGEALLPVVASIADTVGDLASGFSDLPDSIRGGLTSVAAVGGAALLAFAGTSKLLGGIVANRKAMTQLRTEAPRTASALGKVGSALTVIGSVASAASIAGSMFGSGDRQGVATYTKAILELGDGADGSKKRIDNLFKVEGPGNKFLGQTFDDINSLNDAIDALDPGRLEGFTQGLQGVFTETRKEAAEKTFSQVSLALAGLVENGALDEAARGFDYISAAMEKQGVSAKDIKATFPEYTDALAAASVQQDVTGASANKLGGAIDGVTSPTEEAAEALEQAREEARQTGQSFVDLGDDIDNPKVSLGEWLKQLEDQGKALRDFTKNAKRAAKEGLDDGLIASLQAAGPAGALRMAQLADATDAEIKRANRAWRRGQEAIDGYVDATTSVPGAKATDIRTPGAKEAKRAVDALRVALDSINPFKDVYIRTHKSGDDAGNSARAPKPVRRASGGSIVGPGTGTSDDVLMLGSNGEHVLTADDVTKLGGQSEVYRMRAAIQAGDIPAFADGGAVSKLDIANQQRTVRDLERSLRERETVGKGKNKHRRLRLRPGSLDRRIAQMELAEAKAELRDLKSGAEARQKRLDDATGTRDSVASGLTGGFGVAQFLGKNEYGVYGNVTGSSIAAGATAYAAKVKAFAEKFERARRLGIPVRMLQEISGLGVDEGTQALDALLSSSSTDIATIRSAYRDIDTYAKGAGDVMAKALDLQAAGKDAAAGYAKGFTASIGDYATAMHAAAASAAKGKSSKVTSVAGRAVITQPSTGTIGTWSTTKVASAAASAQPFDYVRLAQELAKVSIENNVTAQIAIGNRAASEIVQVGTQTEARQR